MREGGLQSTHFRSVSPVTESTAVLFSSHDMHFENNWPLGVFKSALVQMTSDLVVEVTSPHSNAQGDDGTARNATLCSTSPAARITIDGIKRRMAKISNGYRAKGNEGMDGTDCWPCNECGGEFNVYLDQQEMSGDAMVWALGDVKQTV
jgi:hypothetical protein